MAIRRAEIKRRVIAELAPLSDRETRAVLVDILAEVYPRFLRTLGNENQEAGPAPSSGGSGKTASVLDCLRNKPGTPIEDLAIAAYGDDSKESKAKVRSILASLKKQNRIKKIGKKRGKWKAV